MAKPMLKSAIRRQTIVAATSAMVLAIASFSPAVAGAQNSKVAVSSATAEYGGLGTPPLASNQTRPETTVVGASNEIRTPVTRTGSLPFTGFDVGLLAVLAILVTATGFLLRLAARTHQRSHPRHG